MHHIRTAPGDGDARGWGWLWNTLSAAAVMCHTSDLPAQHTVPVKLTALFVTWQHIDHRNDVGFPFATQTPLRSAVGTAGTVGNSRLPGEQGGYASQHGVVRPNNGDTRTPLLPDGGATGANLDLKMKSSAHAEGMRALREGQRRDAAHITRRFGDPRTSDRLAVRSIPLVTQLGPPGAGMVDGRGLSVSDI